MIDSIHTVLHQVLEMAVEDSYMRNNPSDNALKELARVLKPGGHLVLDYERTGSAVLPFFLRCRAVFQAKYKYLGKPHRSYLYSDKYIRLLLDENNFRVLQSMRFNTLYALWDPLPQFLIKRYYSKDIELSNKKFWGQIRP